MRQFLLATLLVFTLLQSSHAKEQVVVVVGQGAPELEHVAAQEVVAQFKRLFDVRVVLTDFVPDKHENLVLVGGPKKNKAVRMIAGDNWPKLSDQGFILRSFDTEDRKGVIVAGNTPVATLWAVYELGHRFGIRYLLREDIFPDQQTLKLSGFDELMEPELKTRTWNPLGNHATGSVSWPVTDQASLFRQLAKMKFNHLVLSIEPSQPFADYEFQGIRKQSPGLWRGETFPIPRDAPGRTAFGTISEFANSDFQAKQSPQELATSGIKHVRGIISSAKRLGMTVTLQISPVEFPREFEQSIPGLVATSSTNRLSVHPGPSLKPDNDALKELTKVQLKAYAETYPGIDSLHCIVPGDDAYQDLVASAWGKVSKQLTTAIPAMTLQVEEGDESNLQVLSQSKTRQRSKELGEQQKDGGDSLTVRYAMLAEADPTIYYLSRAAWDRGVTAHSAHDELFTTITGEQTISDRLWLGFGHIESATHLAAEHDSEFATLAPNMLLKHYVATPEPTWWTPLTEHYTQAMVELYRSRGPAHPRAQPLLYYYAKRSEYVLEYLACVKAVRSAAIAKAGGDTDAAIEQLEAAIESLYNAIDTLGDVAQDPSDRGLIAALNAYAYRPLMAEYERLLENE